jgi:NAD(P)-dependent dehydrogenase (short-subunit alcohol dehydrogenase family)
MTIADKAVLVTGANRGIGQALVEEALRRARIGCMPVRAIPFHTWMDASRP